MKTETLVALFVERGLEMVVGLLGILKAGGAYVPIDPTSPSERLRYVLEDASVPLVLTEASLRERLPDSAAHVITQETTTAVNTRLVMAGILFRYSLFVIRYFFLGL